MWLVLTHIPSWCFPLFCEIKTEDNDSCFLVREIFLWDPYLQIFDKQSTAQFCSFFGPFVAICSSASSQKQHFGSILELPVKWLLYFPTCFFSSYACFCLLFSDLFWIHSFCCWTFKSRSRHSIGWCHLCSSLNSTSQIVDSRLVTRLSPIIWNILSNSSPFYNLD